MLFFFRDISVWVLECWGFSCSFLCNPLYSEHWFRAAKKRNIRKSKWDHSSLKKQNSALKYFWFSFFFYFIYFYWSIADLQCCASLCCTAEWFSYTHIDIHFYILFNYSFSWDAEYSFLCYTVGPCCSSILYLIVVVQ